jgi:cytochrome c
MKKTFFTIIMLIFGISNICFAGSATPDECIAKCREAAEMIKNKGADAAIAEINKRDGRFVWKDSYVFLMNTEGNMLAHPIKASLVGKNMLDIKDSNGKFLFQEFIRVAKKSGIGWVDYMWPRPGEDRPTQKTSYILKVDGQDLILGAGTYK